MAESPSVAAFVDARSDLTPEDNPNSGGDNDSSLKTPASRRTLFPNNRNSEESGRVDNGYVVEAVVVEDHGTPKYLQKTPEDGEYDSSDVEEEQNDVGDGDSVVETHGRWGQGKTISYHCDKMDDGWQDQADGMPDMVLSQQSTATTTSISQLL